MRIVLSACRLVLFMDFLELATTAAKAAGKLALEKQGHVKVWEKNPQDVVTEADIACEKLIKEMILTEYPDHSFIGEEGGESGDSEYQWVIDPIDGTQNYARDRHEFCTVIALRKNNETLISVIYLPVLDKLYAAKRDAGATCNGEKIVIKTSPLKDSMVCFQYAKKSFLHKNSVKIFDTLLPVVTRVLVAGSSSIAFCELADGQIDAIVKVGKKKLWDVYPGMLIAQEAGATITTFQNNEWEENSESMAAANKDLHQELLALLNS